jgi:hypothetical protein
VYSCANLLSDWVNNYKSLKERGLPNENIQKTPGGGTGIVASGGYPGCNSFRLCLGSSRGETNYYGLAQRDLRFRPLAGIGRVYHLCREVLQKRGQKVPNLVAAGFQLQSLP